VDVGELLSIAGSKSNDKEVLGMILSNRITHCLGDGGDMAISGKQFDVLIEDIMAFIKFKEQK
jgi:hypothetical protein